MDSNGQLKKPGSLIKPKKLCETLKVIAEEGGDSFYNGKLSNRIVEDVKQFGGIITAEDLNKYE